ncbi:MAG: sugar transferase [Thermaceae bacterium]
MGRDTRVKQDWYQRWGKRTLDLIFSSAGLLVLSPLLSVIALAIRLSMGSPVLFRQVRPGLGGRPFVVYKFRTMLDLRDEQGNLLPDEQRLTRLGALLRRWSLDELPQLWNVLKGEMSLVGPRPILRKYLEEFPTPDQARRFEVKPGMTGWAQANGRNALSYEKRFELDVWYVDHLNFWLDLKILLLTLLKVLKGEGVVAENQETASEPR